MSKFYFTGNRDDGCYSKNYFLDYMRENKINQIEVFEAKPVFNIGMFYCKKHDEICEVGECCGKYWCDNYDPLNRKNGRCKHYGYVYDQTDKKKIIKLIK